MKEKTTLASTILALNKLWEHTSKSTIVENVEKYLCIKYPECKLSYKVKMEKMKEISGSQKDTVYAWLNLSRENVKVPFLKLCKIANALDVDIKDMLKNEMKKF